MGLKALMIPAKAIPAGPMFSNVLRPPPLVLAKPGMPSATQTATPHVPPSKGEKPMSTKDDDLDPMARRAAQLAPPVQLGPPIAVEQPSAIVDTQARVSLEEILPALVRKIAWAGDGKRGSVRIELGAGELAGSTLLVHADDGKVRVELSVPPGVDSNAWRDRIHEKLTARGLDVESVEVR
jgi:hypothetical protein